MSPSSPLPSDDEELIRDPEGGMGRLVAIMARLRDPARGCPWDIEQDFDSIAPYTIEEAYEVADAIARRDHEDLRDELGDLLFQVVYHAALAEEAGRFGFAEVVRGISDKMLRRHPHVFGDQSRDKSAAQQTRDWERIKAAERAERATAPSALDGVTAGLPALTRAVKLQNRAARVGFDWPDAGAVLDKIAEESRELVEARDAGDRDRLAEEYGDLMFVMANLARHLGIDPEGALRQANAKFTRRFHGIEAALAERGTRPEHVTLAEMDALWDAMKRRERDPAPTG
ncbi:MAG TPA: nucleoside triphosphate pyrophosphohydrolase [Amaricoccus sp.]|uniref:nucleoside triphosphate pyrophosphohydrolase n=1 Tax=Amaricoccus sp. TaxID=1872485 RepID=UPI002C960CA5|nr:nucleoside triphosphate pyrophosphohydrolase [Amaricoccus sp.]HMQ93106.1 nucleoside triphosphate pyrophosphohydrolase [Amaricoccus sp.]HMR53893.1 nucleoside triphosphate pyrophosphohydrolase [Amaricoccus sp.]HMR60284.1 nucleoside triphosphate pyrophosphohydrolase [Amaricoccus sp.]HMU00918.1 nucleoside triphosphate pyrophosphohydrolase [Amaricoccus sp.]